MTYLEFEKYNDELLDYALKLMKDKNAGYASRGDVMRNFREAAEINGKLPAEVAFNYDLKHIVSIKDIVSGDSNVTPEIWREKITDYLNYGLIINALMQEHFANDK